MTDTPSNISKPQFSTSIANKILIELDGWQLTEETTDSILVDDNEELNIYIDTEDPDELRITNYKLGITNELGMN